MAIEDKLGFLWNLPHTHSPIPAPSCHTALSAQGIQCSHSILVPKAGGKKRASHVNLEGYVNRHSHAICLSALTGSPHRSSRLHSTPSLSGRGKCCRAGGYLFGRPVPGADGEGQQGQDYSRGNRSQAQRGSPKASHVTQEASSHRALKVTQEALCGVKNTPACTQIAGPPQALLAPVPAGPDLPPSLPMSSAHLGPFHSTHYPERRSPEDELGPSTRWAHAAGIH